MCLPDSRGVWEMQLSCVARREKVKEFACTNLWSLFQVEYGHFHRTLRSRILGLKHTLLWTGQSFVKLWLNRWMLTAQKGPWGNLPGWWEANKSTTYMMKSWIDRGFLALGEKKLERLACRRSIGFNTWGF